MHLHVFPPKAIISFIPILIFILVINTRTSLCVDDEYYTNCSKSYKCGDIDISYPFWGEGSDDTRPDYCGYLGFNITCQDDVPRITINTTEYRVLKIEDTTRTLTVARNDYYDDYCPETLLNTTIDISLVNYSTSTSQNLTMYYNCASNTFTVSLIPNQYTCYDNNSVGYYLTRNFNEYETYFVNALGSCGGNVRVPVYQSAIETLSSSQTETNLKAALNGGFGLVWDANYTSCAACTGSDGQCGRNLTTNEFACYCADKSYPRQCPVTAKSETGFGLRVGLSLAIGIPTSVAGIMVVLGLICCYRRKHILYKSMIFRKKKTKNDLDVDAFIKDNGSLLSLKQYNYSDVKKMTKSFTDKLGQGGYGSVYKGKLLDGRLVAVKLLSESKGNGEVFLNEVASISRTSHINVVTLLGFCYERTKRALIYEFMPNGSLDQFIYLEKTSNTNIQLEWKTLYRIAVGIARGLEYLHNGCNTRILHFDIKPHNILLDEEFCPKISDFGLAKLCQRKESIISMLGARGTAGYIAPEVFSRHFGGVSYKSDVYSYGMMILEIVGGRRNIEAGVSQTSEIYFPHWIFKYLEPASTELRLNRVITEDVEEELARKMILVGLWCIQTKPSDLPSMTRVVEMLEGNIQSLKIPPKPFLSSPPRSPLHHSSTVSVSESSSNIG